MHLDERAHAASAGLLRAVPERAVPAHMGRRSRQRIAIATLAAVVLVAGSLALVRRDGGRSSVTTSTNAVPRMLLVSPPRDLLPHDAIDLPSPVMEMDVEIAVYAASVDDISTGPSLAVIVVHALSQDVAPDEYSLEHTDIRGHRAEVKEEDKQTLVHWTEPPDVDVQVIARGIDKPDAVTAAESVDTTSGNVTVDSLPSGLTLQGHVPHAAGGLGVATITKPTTHGHTVTYRSPDAAASLTLSTFEADEDVAAVQRFLVVPFGTPIDVRGHQALISDQDANFVSLLWEEAPGVYALAQAYYLDQMTIVDALQQLRPATDDEWNEIVAIGRGDRPGPNSVASTGTAVTTTDSSSNPTTTSDRSSSGS